MRSLGAKLLLAACATTCCCAPQRHRFRDAPIVWRVADEEDIPPPVEVAYHQKRYMADVLVFRQATRALEVRPSTPAENVNALDEVPDSSWFQNRIGVRMLRPDEAARGGADRGPPVLPVWIERSKTIGNNPGVWVKDRRGRSYLLKLDLPGHPELNTGAEVLVTRIMWAAGYNVPNNWIVELGPGDLRMGPGAVKTNELGEDLPMVEADLAAFRSQASRTRGGRLRAMSSERLEGTPKGGFGPEGTRGDDPNDRIPHEHRRELRGMRVIAAWVNNTDVKQDQSLDMYVREGGRRFLRHYLLDFSESLGGHHAQWGLELHGHEHLWDWTEQMKSLLAFGAYVRPREGQAPSRYPAVGLFDADHFDPPRWKETYPFWPFREMTPADAYWGAKLVLRFDRPLLEAIVAQARYSDPAAAAYVVDTLLRRRTKIGLAWLADAVTPLDNFRVGLDEICAVDLAVLYSLRPPRTVERLDQDGGLTDRVSEDAAGRVCLPSRDPGNYEIARLRVRVGETATPPMQAHFVAGPRPRVLGIVRAE